MSSDLDCIVPDWPAPSQVRAACTTRAGGASQQPWASLNLGAHVGDCAEQVMANRRALAGWSGLAPDDFVFMNQVHGTDVVELPRSGLINADGCTTSQPGVPCVVLTADCLPVLLCDEHGTRVAAAHAGWRGLCEGVLERAVASFEHPAEVMAWLGPAIGPENFEVGPEVREAFVAKSEGAASAFVPASTAGHFLADIYELACQRLCAAGVTKIYGGHWCTVSQPDRFFSYRRDGVTGRMASFIAIS